MAGSDRALDTYRKVATWDGSREKPEAQARFAAFDAYKTSVLSRYLTDVRQVPDIGADGLGWSLEADWPAHLVLAWGELEGDMPGRLRPCANDACRLFLIDRSRAGTARWCSMRPRTSTRFLASRIRRSSPRSTRSDSMPPRS